MSIYNDIEFLTIYNAWRRGAPSPLLIGIAIERVCEAAARYEELRKLNVQQFKDLYLRNLHGENFDEMVDELVKKRAEA